MRFFILELLGASNGDFLARLRRKASANHGRASHGLAKITGYWAYDPDKARAYYEALLQ
jgi:hypothetical protein